MKNSSFIYDPKKPKSLGRQIWNWIFWTIWLLFNFYLYRNTFQPREPIVDYILVVIIFLVLFITLLIILFFYWSRNLSKAERSSRLKSDTHLIKPLIIKITGFLIYITWILVIYENSQKHIPWRTGTPGYIYFIIICTVIWLITISVYFLQKLRKKPKKSVEKFTEESKNKSSIEIHETLESEK